MRTTRPLRRRRAEASTGPRRAHGVPTACPQLQRPQLQRRAVATRRPQQRSASPGMAGAQSTPTPQLALQLPVTLPQKWLSHGNKTTGTAIITVPGALLRVRWTSSGLLLLVLSWAIQTAPGSPCRAQAGVPIPRPGILPSPTSVRPQPAPRGSDPADPARTSLREPLRILSVPGGRGRRPR